MNHHYPELFTRYPQNPLLTAADWAYPIHSVFNPAATILRDGTTLLLCRVKNRSGKSNLCAARSANGVDGWQIDSKPTLLTEPEHSPIETPDGWLVIYHGVRHNAAGALYRLGLALFDLHSPERCLIRGRDWVFGPEASYELRGDVDNVVFPCGSTLAPDGDTLRLYYGAADTCVALATGSVRACLEWLKQAS